MRKENYMKSDDMKRSIFVGRLIYHNLSTMLNARSPEDAEFIYSQLKNELEDLYGSVLYEKFGVLREISE